MESDAEQEKSDSSSASEWTDSEEEQEVTDLSTLLTKLETLPEILSKVESGKEKTVTAIIDDSELIREKLHKESFAASSNDNVDAVSIAPSQSRSPESAAIIDALKNINARLEGFQVAPCGLPNNLSENSAVHAARQIGHWASVFISMFDERLKDATAPSETPGQILEEQTQAPKQQSTDSQPNQSSLPLQSPIQHQPSLQHPLPLNVHSPPRHQPPQHQPTNQSTLQHQPTHHQPTHQPTLQHQPTQHQQTPHQLTQHQPTHQPTLQHQPNQHQQTPHQLTQHQPTHQPTLQHQPNQHQQTPHQLTQHQPTQHQPTQHQPTLHQSTLQHQPTLHQSTLQQQPTLHQSTLQQQPTLHQPPQHQPRLHQQTLHQQTLHQPTLHQPTLQQQQPTLQHQTSSQQNRTLQHPIDQLISLQHQSPPLHHQTTQHSPLQQLSLQHKQVQPPIQYQPTISVQHQQPFEQPPHLHQQYSPIPQTTLVKQPIELGTLKVYRQYGSAYQSAGIWLLSLKIPRHIERLKDIKQVWENGCENCPPLRLWTCQMRNFKGKNGSHTSIYSQRKFIYNIYKENGFSDSRMFEVYGETKPGKLYKLLKSKKE